MRRALASLLVVLLAAGSVPAQAATLRVSPTVRVSAPLAVPSLGASAAAPAASLSLPTASVPLAPALVMAAAPAAPAAAAVEAPQALPSAQAVAEAVAPLAEAPAAQAPAALSRVWDGAGLKAAADDGVAAAEPGKRSTLAPSELAAATSRLKPVPAPRARLTKAATALYWGALTAAAALLHAPFDRIGPLVIGLVMALPMSLMIQVFMGAGRGAVPEPVVKDAKPATEKLMAVTRRVAESMRMPMPGRLDIMPGGFNNAFVQGYSKKAYAMTVSEGLEQAPEERLEAVIRHELAHIKHGDNISRMAQIWLAPVPALLALMGSAVGAPDAAVFSIMGLSIVSFPFFQKLDEYQADQRAAATMGTSAPLTEFFIKDSDHEARAASATTGKAFASERGLKRAALLGWSHLSRFFSSHPAHDLRIARLARLGRGEQTSGRAPEKAAVPEVAAIPRSGPTSAMFSWRKAPSAPSVRSIEKTAAGWLVNGKPVRELGSGSFKRTLEHPDDPELVVKVYWGWGQRAPAEMRSERERLAQAEAAGVGVKTVGSGIVGSAEKPLPYLIQERVRGTTLETMSPAKSAALKAMLGAMRRAGLKLDAETPMVYRRNFMYGTTRSGGERLYLVDPDFSTGEVSPAEYEQVYAWIVGRR